MTTTDPRLLHISDFDYPLPDERIARYPLPGRDSSKLLVYKHGTIQEDTFRNLAHHLPSGALMVFNNTKVIRARLHFRKESGALIEIFLLEPSCPAEYQENFSARARASWHCLVGNSKKWKEGPLSHQVEVSGKSVRLSATRTGNSGTSQEILFEWDREQNVSFAEILEAMGELPIPPYLNRPTEASDLQTYQTVYGRIKGSVAAPTAGLHFTPQVLSALDTAGIERQEVTLHVGAGTFKPVKSEEIGGHDMHTEHIAVSRQTIERLLHHGAQAIAVGTTSVRTLESLYYLGVQAAGTPNPEMHVGQWTPYQYASEPHQLTPTEALHALLRYMDRQETDTLHSTTQIIIAPGYDYKIVQMMVTNFHQPQSTLLLLVSAFINQPSGHTHGQWREIYDYALEHDFRFLSYGDSSLIIP